jgi:hypothetical protein
MVLLVLSVPILACALPGQQISEEEQSCCLHMADECGNPQMGESHSCCNRSPKIAANQLQVTNKFAPVPFDYTVQIVAISLPNVASVESTALQVTPLPESPPGQITVLRI